MLTVKRTLISAAAGIAMAGSLSANAAVIGNIDFGSLFNGEHIETTTLAQSYVNGNGQTAIAYGRVSELNGSTDYCVTPVCSLYFITTFSQSQNWGPTSVPGNSYVEFAQATVSVYYTNSVMNLFSANSQANLAQIATMTPWLTLVNRGVVTGSGQLTGATLSGGGTGQFDVDVNGPGMADVIAALNSNGEPDGSGGFADITLTSSFNNSVLNPQDVATGRANGCKDGTALVGAWCYQGTGNLRGQLVGEVPEPASLALTGLGLGLAGLIGRRRRAAAQK